MRKALSTSPLSAPLSDWRMQTSRPPHSPQPKTAVAIGPEPPDLGTLPKSPRARIAILSFGVYGGILGAMVAAAAASPRRVVPLRTMTVALDAFDVPSAPLPPPPASAGVASQPASSTIRPETATPVPTEVEINPIPAPSVGSNHGNSPAPGQAGGVAGGVGGGTLGGQIGGIVDGQLGGAIAPRFDAAYLQNPEPAYPSLSMRLREEGKVVLRVLVSPDGVAEQVEVRQSSGHVRLDQAALATVRQWRFIPARRGAEHLAAWVLVPLSFQLNA